MCGTIVLFIQTFNGQIEIPVKTDFAAGNEMKAKNTLTCEHPTIAQQCVALVLHSPGVGVVGEERPVVCDYWRVWSNAKPSYRFHQLVMDKIAAHYKIIIPGLVRMKIYSDGCR